MKAIFEDFHRFSFIGSHELFLLGGLHSAYTCYINDISRMFSRHRNYCFIIHNAFAQSPWPTNLHTLPLQFKAKLKFCIIKTIKKYTIYLHTFDGTFATFLICTSYGHVLDLKNSKTMSELKTLYCKATYNQCWGNMTAKDNFFH